MQTRISVISVNLGSGTDAGRAQSLAYLAGLQLAGFTLRVVVYPSRKCRIAAKMFHGKAIAGSVVKIFLNGPAHPIAVVRVIEAGSTTTTTNNKCARRSGRV
jgi:hypothetical protein